MKALDHIKILDLTQLKLDRPVPSFSPFSGQMLSKSNLPKTAIKAVIS